MKRFFCTTCKRVKRVQQWPTIIENQSAELPDARLGQCNFHATGMRTPRPKARVIPMRPAFNPVTVTSQKRKRA